MKKNILLLVLVLSLGSIMLIGCGDDQKESFDGEIVGIGPGAGIMAATENAIEEYELDLELIESSGPVMVEELRGAIEDEEWVVVTGWEPHFKFANWDLKFLEDPNGVYGSVENIHTVGRKGIDEDLPEVANFFENFYLESEELGDLMGEFDENQDHMDNIDIALDWMDANQDIYREWIPEGANGEGEEVKLGYVNWAEGVAMNYLAHAILESEMGYNVVSTQADPGAIFISLANGDQDAFVDAWLPVTHQSYWEEHGENLVDLGYNFEGARIGLVVPSYVDINSIEELNEYSD